MRLTGPALRLPHNDRRIGQVLVGHQPHPVNALAVFLDELAALVFVDRPGNAVGEKPVADGSMVHADVTVACVAGAFYVLPVVLVAPAW